MEKAARLAGFFAAHALWCVSDGDMLIPMLGFETADGKRELHRFAAELIEDGVSEGKAKLEANSVGALRAVLVYDGFVTLEAGKVDALLVDIRDHGPVAGSLLMAVPYRPVSSPKGFAVHRPKFLSFYGPEPDFEAAAAAFFEGVDSHAEAAPIWARSLDETL